MSINTIVISGRLGRDPEMKYTQAGKAVTSFSVAVDRRGRDAGADWFQVTAWEKLGELCSEHLAKGRQVVIRGRMTSREYEKDGAKRTAWDLIAEDVQFIGPREESSEPSAEPAPAQPRTIPARSSQRLDGRKAAELYAPADQLDYEDVPF